MEDRRMSAPRKNGRRSPSRAFRPALDGRLEERLVLTHLSLNQYMTLSQALLSHPNPRAAYAQKFPPFLAKHAPIPHPNPPEIRTIHAAAVQTIRGGQAVNVASVDGTHYRIQLNYISNTVATSAGDGAGGFNSQSSASTTATSGLSPGLVPTEYPQPIGTVRVYPMPFGKIGIVVDGSSPNTELTINPLPQPIRKGYAHSFAYGQSGKGHLINVGQVIVNSGSIGAIEGFHSADLSGPIVIGGTQTVDRIAFNSIQPGASIVTGGSLNTLDVLQGITLNTGTSIQIGRDLNLLNVGQDINLSNGSQINIGRDLGAVLQPPKGTGTGSNVLTLNFNTLGNSVAGNSVPGSVSTFIQGSLNIGAGSAFVIGRAVDYPIYIIGDINGASRVVIPRSNVGINLNTGSPLINLGTVTP
jgi:hypothetical protein